MTESTAKVTVASTIFLLMCSGGFFVARGLIRVGTSLLDDAFQKAHPVDGRRHGSKDLIVGAAIIGGSALVLMVTFALW